MYDKIVEYHQKGIAVLSTVEARRANCLVTASLLMLPSKSRLGSTIQSSIYLRSSETCYGCLAIPPRNAGYSRGRQSCEFLLAAGPPGPFSSFLLCQKHSSNQDCPRFSWPNFHAHTLLGLCGFVTSVSRAATPANQGEHFAPFSQPSYVHTDRR